MTETIVIDFPRIVTAADKTASALDAARNAIAARCWRAETGGATVAGLPVHTDERSRANILGAYLEALEDPGYFVRWQGADGGFVTLDAPSPSRWPRPSVSTSRPVSNAKPTCWPPWKSARPMTSTPAGSDPRFGLTARLAWAF